MDGPRSVAILGTLVLTRGQHDGVRLQLDFRARMRSTSGASAGRSSGQPQRNRDSEWAVGRGRAAHDGGRDTRYCAAAPVKRPAGRTQWCTGEVLGRSGVSEIRARRCIGDRAGSDCGVQRKITTNQFVAADFRPCGASSLSAALLAIVNRILWVVRSMTDKIVERAPGQLVPVQPVKVRREGEGEPPLPPRVMGHRSRGRGSSVDRGACGRGY